jgi:hypothetical protein
MVEEYLFGVFGRFTARPVFRSPAEDNFRPVIVFKILHGCSLIRNGDNLSYSARFLKGITLPAVNAGKRAVQKKTGLKAKAFRFRLFYMVKVFTKNL